MFVTFKKEVKVFSSSNSIEKTAYREAGRATMSYFAGYSCRHLNITEENSTCNLNDFTFGNDIHLINAVSQYKDKPDIYDALPENAKKRCKDIALKTIIVIMGGPAGEALHRNNGKFAGSPLLSIPADDLKIADKIDYFLSIVKQGQHPGNYLQMIFGQVLQLMEGKETWKATSALAGALVQSPEKKLERNEIERILVDTGFLSYLRHLRQGSPQDIETAHHHEGFSREELEKMKKSRNTTLFNKDDAVTKIVSFAKNYKFGQLQIGLAEDNLKDLSGLEKIIVETQSHDVAKEVMMYFVCLGMKISPGSSKSGAASTVYVCS